MARSSLCFACHFGTAAIIASVVVQSPIRAEWSGDKSDDGHGKPVYQRHAFDWKDKRDNRHKQGRFFPHQFVSPQVNSGWFQRPYPYHLDYYKMRYGGSYAPYFGNLYGPPQVVTAPPYYGPYYGNFGYGDSGGFGQQGGFGGMPGGNPGFPNGMMYQGPVETVVPQDESTGPTNGEGLPSPSP